jgi:hypothetical protein
MSQPATTPAIAGIVCWLVRWIMLVMVPPRLRGGIGLTALLQRERGAPTGGRRAA